MYRFSLRKNFFYKNIVLFPLTFLVLLPISAEEKRVLKVGTVDNYLPCSDLVDGNFEGLSVDMWRAIAEKNKIHYDLSIIPTFGQAVDDAAYGKYDLIASCHKITADRLKKATYAVPYTEGTLGFLSRKKQNNLFIIDLFSDSIVLNSILILTAVSLTGSILLYKVEKGHLEVKDLSEQKRTTIMNKFANFVVGEYGELTKEKKGMWIVIFVAFSRILIISTLVGSSASLIFKRDAPKDANALNDESIRNIVYTGVTVNKATKMDDWLQNKVNQSDTIDSSKVKILRATGGEPELVSALKSGKVNHILSDIAVLNRILANIENPDDYVISVKNPNVTPQAFIFGANLEDNYRKSINITISEFIRSGKSRELGILWNKLIN